MRAQFAMALLAMNAAAAQESSYRPPRLPDGQPDMQGVWIASNSTPLQRPTGYPTLRIDDAQAMCLPR